MRQLWIRENRIVISRLARVELASALARRERAGSLTAEVSAELWDAFLYDCSTAISVVAVTDQVCARAETLVRAHPLKALDVLHIATTLEVSASLGEELLFVTADRRQAGVARDAGLAVRLIA